ncbi:MAG: alpha/beta hydrolase [Rickettsiales bacterium]|nr:alpha/beta hydrolase [Rickettsiales bacterium]
MRIMCVSGWGQAHDALANLYPDATHVDYAHLDPQEALALISEQGRAHECWVGWSLGAQLLTRVIAAHEATPQSLVMLAPPFQFVENTTLPLGMKRDQYQKFHDNYKANPKRTLSKAWELVVKADAKEQPVRAQLPHARQEEVLAKDWLSWLVQLEQFSCASLSFDHFPPSLLIHGSDDAVVNVAQSAQFARHLPRATVKHLSGCGHAPHWHDPAQVKSLIDEHCHV